MQLTWTWKTFQELTPHELYAIWHLRESVFIVEQNEVYLDADGKDQHSWHLLGCDTQGLIAYARVILPQQNEPLHFGRVIVKQEYRRRGIASDLVNKILAKINQSEFAQRAIEISAQAHLENFYASFGFQQNGEIFYEGKIPHVPMRKNSISPLDS